MISEERLLNQPSSGLSATFSHGFATGEGARGEFLL